MTPRVPVPFSGPQEQQSIVGGYGPFGEKPEMVPTPKPIETSPLRPPGHDSTSVDADVPVDDGIGQAIADAVAKLRAGAGELIDAFNNFLEGLTAVGPIAADVVERVQEVLDEITKWLQRVLDTVGEVLERHAPFLALLLASANWVTHVQAPMATMAADLPRQEAADLTYWEGKAKNRYIEKRDHQQEAMTKVSAAAEHISDWLGDIAKYNVAWIARLWKLEVDLGMRIVQIALSTRDPEALVKGLKEVLVEVIKEAANELIDGTTRIIESVDAKKELQQYVARMGMAKGWTQAVEG